MENLADKRQKLFFELVIFQKERCLMTHKCCNIVMLVAMDGCRIGDENCGLAEGSDFCDGGSTCSAYHKIRSLIRRLHIVDKIGWNNQRGRMRNLHCLFACLPQYLNFVLNQLWRDAGDSFIDAACSQTAAQDEDKWTCRVESPAAFGFCWIWRIVE